MKACSKCKELKPKDSFYPHKGTRSGLHSQCKPCEAAFQSSPKGKEKNRIYRLENAEYLKYYSGARRSDPAFRLKKSQYDRQYRGREKVILTARMKRYKRLWKNCTHQQALDNYNNLYKAQQERCAICRRHQSLVWKTLCVDHDHKTGEVRGLLCDNCNRGIGLMNDDPALLKRAVEYLKKVTKNG